MNAMKSPIRVAAVQLHAEVGVVAKNLSGPTIFGWSAQRSAAPRPWPGTYEEVSLGRTWGMQVALHLLSAPGQGDLKRPSEFKSPGTCC